jgi:hypothetical protein
MGLSEDIKLYQQPDKLIVPRITHEGPVTQDETGDGIKHFCIYHALKVRRGESRPEDLKEFDAVIDRCYKQGYPGIPNRSPTKLEEQISKDAIVAIAYTAKLMKSKHAWLILNAGNSMRLSFLKWFYPNMFPEQFARKTLDTRMYFKRSFWECWMGKNPETICHIQYCGLPHDHRPNILRQIWLWVFLLVSSVERGSIYSLAYMMAESAKGYNSLGDFFIHIWEDRMNKVGGMVARLKSEYDADHPIVRYWV